MKVAPRVLVFVIFTTFLSSCSAEGNEKDAGLDFKKRVEKIFSIKKVYNVKTKSCSKRRDSKKCTLDLGNLRIDDADQIDFQLKPNGRTIKCSKSNAKVNAKRGKSWHAECDGIGSVNILLKGKNKHGKDLLFGSLVDGDEICHLCPNADGENEVTCTPSANFPDEANPYELSISEKRDLGLLVQQVEIDGT
jgi:hypothetical protein